MKKQLITSANTLRTLTLLSSAGLLLLTSSTNLAQSISQANQVWSAEVIRPKGQPIIPLFDGWYPNEDGSSTICFGFFNMNSEQSLDIPLGEDNYIETDYPGLDLSEVLIPTHFDPLPPAYRHVFCAYSINVPADFNTSHRITWYLTANNQTLSVPGKVIPPYVLDEPRSNGRGDVAPLVTLTEDGESVRGRSGIHHPGKILSSVSEPVSLSAYIEHSDDIVWVGWSKHNGPGTVTFDKKEYETKAVNARVQARFSKPGNYVIRMQTIDDIAALNFTVVTPTPTLHQC